MKKPGKMLGEVLSNAVKVPATSHYPFVKSDKATSYRGKIISYEANCIGCKICMRDCPAGAVTITKVADKKFEVTMELDKCIYCGQCVDSCPKKALAVTSDYELAALDRSKLTVRVNAEIEANAATEP